MSHRRKGTGPSVYPLDPEKKLYETASREVWQSLLTTSDGEEIGPVIRQVIEPRMYTVRYLVVYDVTRDRHVLLPSNTIVGITDSRVHSSLDQAAISQLPAFGRTVTRGFEEELYEAVGRTPYWVEEEVAMAKRDDSPENDPST